MKKSLIIVVATLLLCATSGFAQKPDAKLKDEVQSAIAKGISWLQKVQKDDGSWSDANAPALTALPLWAIVACGSKEYQATADKAVTYLLGKQQPDGGIYVPIVGRPGSGLGTYNTAVCLSALYATSRRDVIPAVLKARDYVAQAQHIGADHHAGGFGYDPSSSRRYSDLNNTVFSIDAMRRTEAAEELRPAGQKRADLNWEAALKYVSQMQEREGENAGGFTYTMQNREGVVQTNASGRIVLNTYGSISYAGLLALVHAKLDKSDPRVRSAVEYASRFWTLDENPGQGAQGLYFYYNIMTRALSASGLNEIDKLKSADKIKWRADVIRKVVALQKEDGSWVNDNNRWWENDPVLVTSYSLLALEFAAALTE